MAITLQQLRYLIAVADEGSLTSAARKLGVTQPVLSRALSNLRDELKAPILKRSDRKLVLTPQGEAALIPARRALAALEDVKRVALRRHQRPLLNIAAQSTMLAAIAPTFGKTLDASPDMMINLQTAESTEALAEALGNDQIDLVFGERIPSLKDIKWRPWNKIEVVLVSPPGTDLPEEIELRDTEPLRLLSIPQSVRRQRTFDDLFLHAGVRPNIAIEMDDLTLLFPLVQAGVGSFHAWRFIAASQRNIEMRSYRPRIFTEIGFSYVDRRKDAVRDFIAQAMRQPWPIADDSPVAQMPTGYE